MMNIQITATKEEPENIASGYEVCVFLKDHMCLLNTVLFI